MRKQVVDVEYNGNVTKCLNCAGIEAKGLGNCHIGCAYGDGEDKKSCSSMDSDGYCNKCNCSWNDQVNSHHYKETKDVEIRTTNA